MIINDKFEEALDDIEAVIRAQRCDMQARRAFWQKLLAEF